jgi:hypothetical protein
MGQRQDFLAYARIKIENTAIRRYKTKQHSHGAHKMQKKIDKDMVARLVALYRTDPVARRLFDWLAVRQNDATETTVERAAAKSVTSYSEMLRLFKKIEDLGIGTFIEGRRGHKSRITWLYSVRSIGEAAREEVGDLRGIEPGKVDNEGDEPENEEHAHSSSQSFCHRLQLRTDFEVCVDLPRDLTQKEAERIAVWVRSLPFGD